VDENGNVETTVFASLVNARGGLGVPSALVEHALAAAERGATATSTGCAP
jgi:hypothetical protein